MNLQVSRIWHRRYGRPRTASGTFASGVHLYTRADKSSRWLAHFPEQIADAPTRQRASWLTEQNRRVIRDLIVIIVAAALVAFFGGL